MFRPLVRDNFVTIANKHRPHVSTQRLISGFISTHVVLRFGEGRNSIRCKEGNAPTSFQTRLALRLGASNECEQVFPSLPFNQRG
jgi:hypothetical protein